MTEKRTGIIYSVSKLTKEIKTLLEGTYPFIWITGEISNLSSPFSGHSYFTLKDHTAVISSVMFKNQKRNLKFNLETGMKIVGMARLGVYEPRGSYQLIFEHLEPEGAGSMQVAFEQLKRKLSDKGIFEPHLKKPIPFFPDIICIITSRTGAAVKDIINVCQRRCPNCQLEILPVNVQGSDSAVQISEAIECANLRSTSDVIILARGGGSLEDLSAFNSELVAMAVFNSDLPIITGIGHETDFTISDFAADLRAPTPSAAAELALPDQQILRQKIVEFSNRLHQTQTQRLFSLRQFIDQLNRRLKSPEMQLYDFRLKLEDFHSRLLNTMEQALQYNREKHTWLFNSFLYARPEKIILDKRKKTIALSQTLTYNFKKRVQGFKTNILNLDAKLQALSPKAVLKRGYSISRRVKDKRVILNSGDVKIKDQLEVILSKGTLIARVEKTNGQEKNV